ncbi:tyrosine-type recombinase/integrase [Streptomyces sp. NPDC056697]|uniref:tyrosine-type recombinase/integrase n=1 Tax=Streptomyces sp. NPDC056697 TaxID=3345915 RepID=UPI0036CDBE95
MRSATSRGRVYRRCGCRDRQHQQLGARCPRLAAEPDHGRWTFAVDLPSPTSRRHTVRRSGFPTQEAATAALHRMLEGEDGGFSADPNQTVADYLITWLTAKALILKPTTMARYRNYVTADLIPALGQVRLDDLGYSHIAGFVHTQLAHGRGKVTIHRCLATLSSALGDAVKHHRLSHNPARPTIIPRPPAAERRIWTLDEATRFLRYCHAVDPLMADLVEVLIGTGMRKGEALGLHWSDVHLPEGMLFIRCTLSAVDNNRLVLTAPKTRSSKNWIAISPRVATALRRRRAADPDPRQTSPGGDLVFHRPDGRPLHPEYVLNHFHYLARQAAVPRTTVHDLRHLAATISITADVPLTVVSKTLRHSTLSTTANIYSHLTPQAARTAVNAIDTALTTAEHKVHPPKPRPPCDHNPRLHNQITVSKAPARAISYATTPGTCPAYATTLRPQPPKTPKRPPPPSGGSGLRPAKTLVGTTGFEPATP